ncbi:MAG: outer membrane protein assembly factor BamD [Phycisphaeraceae bacterium]|nr:MAG: outer membrane protein assembly factor BamD [Phycisphaeraceae bacterium]
MQIMDDQRLSPSPRRLPLSMATWVVLIFLLSPVAMSQGPVYTLDEDGRWRQTEIPEQGSDEAILAEARGHLADGNPRAARSILNSWIDEHQDTDNPWLPTAYLMRGDARAAAGNEFRALFDYERVIRRYPQSEEFRTAIEREVDIASDYVRGKRRKFLGMRISTAYGEGEEMLLLAQQRLPGSSIADRAAIELADHYFRRGQMPLAEEAYELYGINFPNGPNRAHALERRIYANIAMFHGHEYDASSLIDADQLIRTYIRMFPAEAEQRNFDDALLSRIEESVAAQMLDAAEWRLRRGDGPSARFTLRRLVRRHPQTASASRAIQILNERGWLEQSPEYANEAQTPAEDADETGVGREAEPARP